MKEKEIDIKLSIFYDHIIDVYKQQGLSINEAALKVHRLGIDYVELNSSYLIGDYDKTLKILDDSNLEISCMCHECDFGMNKDISGAKYVIDMAADIDKRKVLIIPGKISCEERRSVETEQMITCVRNLSEYAYSKNVVLCLEAFDDINSPLSGQGLLKFLENCEMVRCAFDTGNFLFWNDDVMFFLDVLKEWIVHVHLKDRSIIGENGERSIISTTGECYYPSSIGNGIIKMGDIFEKLQMIDYDGIYAIEHYGAANQLEYIRKSVKWIQSYISQKGIH